MQILFIDLINLIAPINILINLAPGSLAFMQITLALDNLAPMQISLLPNRLAPTAIMTIIIYELMQN